MSKCTISRLQYQLGYHSLLNALYRVYGSSSSESDSKEADLGDPLYAYPGARAVLEERYGEEDTLAPSPEDALDCLLDAAIDHFGYSARDVFGAVFNYAEKTELHELAFDIKCSDLEEAVTALAKNRSLGDSISHRLLTLHPVDRGFLMPIGWNVDFKSDWIAKNVIQHLNEGEEAAIFRQFNFFQLIPGARGLAGRLLEPLAHRSIARTTGGFWPLTNMKSNDTDPPRFILERDSPVADNVQFIKMERKIVKLQAIANLSTCRLESNSYYVPSDPNFPLFDAFIIEFDRVTESAILWILQITTSRRHRGSALGYRKIREIIAILKNQLQKVPSAKKRKTTHDQATPTPLVQVRYLLVVPEDKSESLNFQWQFPKGWGQNRKRNNHGEVYCLSVPLKVCAT